MKDPIRAKDILTDDERHAFVCLKHMLQVCGRDAQPDIISIVEECCHRTMKELKYSVGNRIFLEYLEEEEKRND